ncbi:type II toxin-antitoxin system HicB family antitoxin [Candidatus Amarolinea aalborgensis]|jgi:predicted RNase H-like HicB family nuclease|uniref:type II toxin-antitoxin system HicB family antitoxin n=1 Tax=Candidatus Amarolinea aalborgensis TaxID=2249329 RepID=UPI003BF99A3D
MATYRITLEIEHLPEGPYLGTSPDLPGLIVQAETAEEVIRLAPDIAADLIQVMQEMGQPLPTQLVALFTPLRVPIAVPA